MGAHLVVVGASLAGLRAVEAARRSGHAGPITLIGAEDALPYDRPPLSKRHLAPDAPAVPPLKSEDHLRGELGVDLRLGCEALGLDVPGRAVLTTAGAVPFDALVVATGSRPRTLPLPDLEGVHVLRTADDAGALARSLDGSRRVGIVGSGFIGSEVASAARARGLDVVVVEAMSTPLLRSVGPAAGPLLAALHGMHGVELRTGVEVVGLEGAGRVSAMLLSDGSRVPADTVVVGVGAVPAVEWLRGSGLEIGDGVVCDATLSAGPRGITAAGDVCNFPDERWGRRVRLEHWTNAVEQGAHAALTALDPDGATAFATIPYVWSEWYGVRIQLLGRSDTDDVEVLGDPDTGRFVVLHRVGDEFAGVLTVGRPGETMKYRPLLARRAPWTEALAFAAERAAAAGSAARA